MFGRFPDADLHGRRQQAGRDVPNERLDTVRARVEEGNAYKGEISELMATNAQLLLLGRRARKQEETAAKRRADR